tara:strand:- start:25946 stop:26236 length:291 start_codon:yes stop_codon:yes gene_type:complete
LEKHKTNSQAGLLAHRTEIIREIRSIIANRSAASSIANRSIQQHIRKEPGQKIEPAPLVNHRCRADKKQEHKKETGVKTGKILTLDNLGNYTKRSV